MEGHNGKVKFIRVLQEIRTQITGLSELKWSAKTLRFAYLIYIRKKKKHRHANSKIIARVRTLGHCRPSTSGCYFQEEEKPLEYFEQHLIWLNMIKGSLHASFENITQKVLKSARLSRSLKVQKADVDKEIRMFRLHYFKAVTKLTISGVCLAYSQLDSQSKGQTHCSLVGN